MTALKDHYLNMTIDQFWSSGHDHPSALLFEDHLTDSQAALDHVMTIGQRLDLLRRHGANREADIILQDIEIMSQNAASRCGERIIEQ